MKDSWLPIGSSDPVSFTCSCSGTSTPTNGLVLLFYRYFSSPPSLPLAHQPIADDPSSLAAFQTQLTNKYLLGGKIRVSNEGFNITVAGSIPSINAYIRECVSHWSFSNLPLSGQKEIDGYFKPTPGCSCVFGGAPASVRVTAEITPMGVANYSPESWDEIESLDPAEFHRRCMEKGGEDMLVDVRNYYESRIGYFVDGEGREALRPGVRRFSQWPLYVRTHMQRAESDEKSKESSKSRGRQIMTYCTGGIRCEKGARWMQENMEKKAGDRVCTLQGGIAAYLTWMDDEIKAGRRTPQDSLFKGKNYVFDARGSTGLSEGEPMEPVSTCHDCGKLEDRLSKCRSRGCHLVLVICQKCEQGDPRCCASCLELDSAAVVVDEQRTPRQICACEKQREAQLWGDRIKKPKTQGWRTKAKLKIFNAGGIDIQIKAID